MLFLTEVAHQPALLVISWNPETSSCVNKLHFYLYLLYHMRCTGNVLVCCLFSFGRFPGVWFIYSDVSEHSICSIFKGRCEV